MIQERDLLLNELDVAREHLSKLHQHNEELEAKSKADVKLLVKEVKSLRSSQSELKQELGRLMREKIEVEVICRFYVIRIFFHKLRISLRAKTSVTHHKQFLFYLLHP